MTRYARHVPSIFLACVVTVAWMWNPGHHPRYDQTDAGYQSFRDEIEGRAPKGVCYRVLVPSICRAAQETMPGFAREIIANLVDHSPASSMQLDRDLLPAHAAAAAVALVSYIVLGVLFGPLALLLAWAAIGSHGGVGDPVTAAAFATAVWALAAGRLRWFWLAFVAASLNRETAPLMLVWWVLAGNRLRWAAFAIVAWAVLRGFLAGAFSGNEMQMCWPMLARNLKQIAPLSATSAIASIAVLPLLIRGLALMPAWSRRGFLIGLTALFMMAVLWSRPERLRVYLELLPMCSSAILLGLRSIIALPITWRSPDKEA